MMFKSSRDRFLILGLATLLGGVSCMSLSGKSSCSITEKVIRDQEFSVSYIDHWPGGESGEGSDGGAGALVRDVVLIIPPTGGTNFIDRSYARSLCRAGLRAVILNHWSEDDEHSYELEIHTRFYNRAQRAIDLLVSEFLGGADGDSKFGMKSEEEGKSQVKIGVLGTSVGALHGSVAFARRPEITSGFFIVGGGDIADIIVHSDQGAMKDAKEVRRKKYGFKSDEEYQAAVEKVLPYEPLKIPFDRSRKRLGMVISESDQTVPGKNQLLMRDQWKPEVVYSSRWQHMGAIVSTWLFQTDDVVKFFK